MGRTAQPAALKLIKGRGNGKDSGGRPVNAGPAFKRLPPEPPEWLSDEAAAEWARVLPELARLDLVKEGDRSALAAYCEAWATFRDATETVQREGLTIQAAQGTLAHPAVAIARNAGKEVRAWAAHFGLTPSTEQALARGADDGNEDENPFA
ncbi:phage terminase small subunit P27 family [Streptomyces alfalfae]|uniref:Terminase n=1 Tax=Streptomyces alfalfae TaxID=1642299 RepID=A0ABM6GVQ7_9ACTN|nr:phage terminase small subunit P27 family [Streptomyces alfalfae]APY88180.1 terminase [Streptomyces alfalfae]AYA18576.1 phage terminase small subunit P27 family [Streptomyces fradiae]RXX46543.1 phage terminase small subunit P27 family [Streptomyces alfalfae]RZM90056.1 phage terminase small subunit P27 family [Streptomyces alfalfae]